MEPYRRDRYERGPERTAPPEQPRYTAGGGGYRPPEYGPPGYGPPPGRESPTGQGPSGQPMQGRPPEGGPMQGQSQYGPPTRSSGQPPQGLGSQGGQGGRGGQPGYGGQPQTQQPSYGPSQSAGPPQTGGQPMGQPSGQSGPGGPRGPPGQQSTLAGQQSRWGQPLVRPISADEIAQRDVVTVQPDTPVRTVVATMAEHDVGTVVVVEDERAVGLVTDRMVALALESDPDVTTRKVRELMTESLVTVTTGTNLDEVVSVLRDEGIRRVPIVDDQERLRGIVSLDDVVVLLSSQFDRIAEVVEKQAPRF